MKTIYNRIIPFGNFKAMAVWPFIFVRSDKAFNEVDFRHEMIHGEQQKELLIVGFWLLYCLFAAVEFVRCLFDKERGQNTRKGRKIWSRVNHVIIFEREAYTFQKDEGYLSRRKHYAWVKC